MKKIAIIDDHFATRNGYKDFIITFDFVQQVDVFENSIDFYVEHKIHRYDLVMIDIELKTENGIEVCLKLKTENEDNKVLILSSFHSQEYIISSYRNRADGYIFKDSDSNTVKRAIEEIIIHKTRFFEDEANRIIINLFHSIQVQKNSESQILSSRELEILILVCKGKSHKEIGSILKLKENTISTHKQNIMKKLDVHKTVDLYRWAEENGIYSHLKTQK